MVKNGGYEAAIAAEKSSFTDRVNVHDLPEIFHYWSARFVRPMIDAYGFTGPDEFFTQYLLESGVRCSIESPRFISIGAGNCDTEVRVARSLRALGLKRFVIECYELNASMLERGHELAKREGLLENLSFVETDINRWVPDKPYHAVMANHSLHHVLNLEGLFDAVKRSLDPRGFFVINDMIGRNGHQRWPEALEVVHRFWRELPVDYRYNRLLNRTEELYENWDCSSEGFEGIRAQDILPLLLQRFDFRLFIGFSNAISVFVDRCFGHNFQSSRDWDRDFIDRVQQLDEEKILAGELSPCQMFGVLSTQTSPIHMYARGLSPERSVRPPNR